MTNEQHEAERARLQELKDAGLIHDFTIREGDVRDVITNCHAFAIPLNGTNWSKLRSVAPHRKEPAVNLG
jgi:hypothetical protein